MLVRTLPGTLSGPEQLVRQWLLDWPVPGIAVLNCRIPASTRLHQADALLILPSGVLVLEIKGFYTHQNGELLAPPKGTWTVSGRPAALHNQKAANPAEQARAAMFAAKDAITASGNDPGFHRAAAVLVPLPGSEITCGADGHHDYDKGVAVIVASGQRPDALLHHLRHAARTSKPLDRPSAVRLLAALGLDDLEFTYNELHEQGFAEPAPPGPASTPASASAEPAYVAPMRAELDRIFHHDQRPLAGRSVPQAVQSRSRSVTGRLRGWQVRPARLLPAALITLVLVAGASWLFSGRSEEPGGQGSPPRMGVAPAPPPPSKTPQLLPAPPQTAPPPAQVPTTQRYPAGQACFPFQPRC